MRMIKTQVGMQFYATSPARPNLSSGLIFFILGREIHALQRVDVSE